METHINKREELYKLLPENFTSIELGVAEGLFSLVILSWSPGKHYMVDAWKHLKQSGDGGFNQQWHDKNYFQAFRSTKDYSHIRTIIRELTGPASAHFKPASIDFIYIDADHSYAGATSDTLLYWPKLKPGGVMAFHDYLNRRDYGVYDAVNQFAEIQDLEINPIPENDESDAGAWIRKPLK